MLWHKRLDLLCFIGVLVILNKILGINLADAICMDISKELDLRWSDFFNATHESLYVDGVQIGETPYAMALANLVAERNNLPSYDNFILELSTEPVPPEKPTAEKVRRYISERSPLSSSMLEKAFSSILLREMEKEYFISQKKYEENMRERNFLLENYQPSLQGYFKFLGDNVKYFYRLFFDEYKKLPLSEENRKSHTYIVGSSGSGKSELIKNIFYHYLNRNTNTALVLIEPHGKLSREISRWPELQGDRLVYIRPGIDGDHTPTFNPFDIDDCDRNNKRVLTVLVDSTVEIVAEILDRDFTTNMDVLLRACFYVLFSRKGSTFYDVLRFVDVNDNADLVRQAKDTFEPDSPLLEFIMKDLASNHLATTRQAVKMRFTSLLSRPFFKSFLIGRSTFNIRNLIAEKKCIIFNLSSSDIGTTESRIFGRFIVSHVKAFGFDQGREENKMNITNIHLFIDECQEFITPSLSEILEQLRKFGVHLTLAQQTIGRGMSNEMEASIMTNAAIKIMGKNSDTDYKKFCSNTNTPMELMHSLNKGRGWFCFSSTGMLPIALKVSSGRIDDSGSVSSNIWEKTWADQIEKYYAKKADQDLYGNNSVKYVSQSNSYKIADALPSNFEY